MKRDLAPVLDVAGLSKRFVLHERGGAVLDVLWGVSFEVHAGECVALVGPSGQGKSTLLKCLYGSYAADAGTLHFDTGRGRVDLVGAAPRELLALRRRDIAYVSQFLRAVPRVGAIDVVAERAAAALADEAAAGDADADADGDAGWQQRRALAREHAAAVLERLRLPPALWPLPPATFSGGEQQRVNIARGFVVPSRLLLLDEPTASLDAANRRLVVGLIEEAKARGSAVVGIFHDEVVRAAVATRCIDLREGRR